MNITTTAVTLAIILVVGAILVFVFRFYDPLGIGLNKARSAFPELAKELGLEFIAPESASETGQLRGEFRGYTVHVAPPNDPSGLSLKLNVPVEVMLSMEQGNASEVPEGMREFRFRDDSLNGLFKSRYATAALVDRLESSDGLTAFARSFKQHWSGTVSRLEYSNGYIHVRFKYGLEQYIPAKAVRPMLDDLVALAGALESL